MFLLLLASLASAAERPAAPIDEWPRIDGSKPPVSVAYVREDGDDVEFRLANNTPSTIKVPTPARCISSSPLSAPCSRYERTTIRSGDRDLVLFAVEDNAKAPHSAAEERRTLIVPDLAAEITVIPKNFFLGNYQLTELRSGDDVLFTVPRRRIDSGVRLFVPFLFEWDDQGLDIERTNDPSRRAYLPLEKR